MDYKRSQANATQKNTNRWLQALPSPNSQRRYAGYFCSVKSTETPLSHTPPYIPKQFQIL